MGRLGAAELADLLERTSRTFALAIPLLEEPLATQVGAAYLLFRIADTFEDASLWNRDRRLDKHGSFLACTGYPECTYTRELTVDLPDVDGANLGEQGEDEYCENCGRPMVLKKGRFGTFFACSGYPDCKTTKQIGAAQRKSVVQLDEKCPQCDNNLVQKYGRFGEFTACSNYPACKFIKQKTIGVKCPECSEGEVVERRSKRGKTFFGCTEAAYGHALEHWLDLEDDTARAVSMAEHNRDARPGGEAQTRLIEAYLIAGRVPDAVRVADGLVATEWSTGEGHAACSIAYRLAGHAAKAESQRQRAEAVCPGAMHRLAEIDARATRAAHAHP